MSEKKYKYVGTRPIRHDGFDKVTGRAQFGADQNLPGMLQGAILRSPHAHARIKGIDTSKALALDGVKAVIISAADVVSPEGFAQLRSSRLRVQPPRPPKRIVNESCKHVIFRAPHGGIPIGNQQQRAT